MRKKSDCSIDLRRGKFREAQLEEGERLQHQLVGAHLVMSPLARRAHRAALHLPAVVDDVADLGHGPLRTGHIFLDYRQVCLCRWCFRISVWTPQRFALEYCKLRTMGSEEEGFGEEGMAACCGAVWYGVV